LIADAAGAACPLGAPLGVVDLGQPLTSTSRVPRLMSEAQQNRALEALGVDILYALPSDAQPAGIGEERFARNVLGEGLRVRHVVVGAEFAEANASWSETLVRQGAALGFSVGVATLDHASEMERCTRDTARDALEAGRPERAADVLGRPFAIGGIVVEGQKLGRSLGFPTANVAASEYVRPMLGVYATRSRLADGREIPGVANFGVNPTTGVVEARLEVYLFDFDEDIYGENLETDLITFLRPEVKFPDLPTMIAQIVRDVDQARALVGPESVWQ
jgi:riboflavin kinase/FMN adenylyltransferase